MVLRATAGSASTDTANVALRQKLPNYRNALSQIRAGTGRGRIVMLGDSTMVGTGAGTGTSNLVGAYPKTQTADLAAQLTSLGIPCSFNGNFSSGSVPNQGVAYGSYNPSVSLGASVTFSGFNTIGSDSLRITGTGAAFNLAWTPTGQINTAVIYWVDAANASPGVTSMNVNFDGGATATSWSTDGSRNGASALNNNTGTTTLGSHTVNLVPATPNAQVIAGMIAYNSAVPAFDMMLGGWAGQDVEGFVASGVNRYGVTGTAGDNFWSAVSPALAIIELTINDAANHGIPGLPNYITNLTTLVQSAQNQGNTDVIIATGVPSDTGTTPAATTQAFFNAAQQVANATGALFVDTGDAFGPYVKTNALGWMYNSLHPSATGYQAFVTPLASVLFQAQ